MHMHQTLDMVPNGFSLASAEGIRLRQADFQV
jgi:hypothetical protein